MYISAFDCSFHIRLARTMLALLSEHMAIAKKRTDEDEIQVGQPRFIQATKPRVFIGSSPEHLNIKEALRQGATQSADAEVWNQGILEASEVFSHNPLKW